jgi:ABC-type transport system substrate-binding protein
MAGHSPGIGLPYDPEGARRLLAEAGYRKGRGGGFPEVLLVGPDLPFACDMCEYLEAQWRDILGVELIMEWLDWADFGERMRKGPKHMFVTGWSASYPDPDGMLRGLSGSDDTGWRAEAFERLLEQARRSMDQGVRVELYRQADRILVEEVPIMPLFYFRDHSLVKPWVRGYTFSSFQGARLKDVIIEPH